MLFFKSINVNLKKQVDDILFFLNNASKIHAIERVSLLSNLNVIIQQVASSQYSVTDMQHIRRLYNGLELIKRDCAHPLQNFCADSFKKLHDNMSPKQLAIMRSFVSIDAAMKGWERGEMRSPTVSDSSPDPGVLSSAATPVNAACAAKPVGFRPPLLQERMLARSMSP